MANGLKYVVIWFPPDKPSKEAVFKTEAAAMEYAQEDHVKPWAPMVVWREVIVSEGVLWNSVPTA